MTARWTTVARALALVLLVMTVGGCAAQKAYQRAEREMRRENLDEAVLNYSKAVALEPGNTRFAVALERAKLKSAAMHFQKGKRLFDSGQVELAIAEFQQTLLLNPGHQYANNEMDRAIRELRRRQSTPSSIEQLKEEARRKDLGPPKLNPQSNIPILLNFQDVEVSKIFEAMSKASGINYIFDDKVDLQKPMTIEIGNVSLEKALDIMMLQTKNFYMVIDEYTLLVAPDTRQKRQEYEDQVIRTFFLSNAETKTVVTLLRSLLQSRQIAENPELNSITLKDTPAKVAIAERIINANDKAKGEVLIDVELLEINRSVSQTLGIDLSSKTLSLTFGDGSESVPLNNFDSLKQRGNWTIGVIPSVVLNFLKSDAETKLIAKPQLRVAEGERAEILIGDRIPIPTTSFNTSQTVGGNIVPITSFTYQNVGITVQIEPRVHHNKEITLTVQVEISQVSGFVDAGQGQSQPIIGTRQIQTVIRLRDGETNLLAGLIQRTDQDTVTGIPGLTDIPGLRRVFSNNQTQNQTTDIVMTLTPRIIRVPDITEEDLLTLWVGTEENMRLRGPARNALNQSPFRSEEPDVPAPAAEPTPGAGSVSRITPSDAVEQDRAAAAAQQPAQGDDAGSAGQPAVEPGLSRTQGASEPGAEDPGAGEPEDVGDGGAREDDPPSGPAVVSIVPGRSIYHIGDVVDVEVRVDNAENIGSIPFHLRYNPAVLQFIEPGQKGPFMEADGANIVFLAKGTGGEVVVGLSRLGAPAGASGSGTLAYFRFQALAAGSAGFAFTGASVKDPKARNLPAAFNATPVQIQP